MAIIHPLVEGNLDEAVALKMIKVTGHIPGTCYGKKGADYIRRKIQSFNLSARSTYYLALVDLMDTNLSCSPDVLAEWLPHRQPKMLFRVVEREIESWLIADRNNLSAFLKIKVDRIPANPEQIHDPKLALINLARHSISSRIRSALVPEVGSTAQVGKLYNSEMRVFIDTQWDVSEARVYAPSLDRCLSRLESVP